MCYKDVGIANMYFKNNLLTTEFPKLETGKEFEYILKLGYRRIQPNIDVVERFETYQKRLKT